MMRAETMINTILCDRALDDLIRWLDEVREVHKQAHAPHAERDIVAIQNLQFLIDDALREVADFLYELRCKQLGI